MTSSTNIIDAMESAEFYLYRIGGPVIILIGTIGSLLNLLVFTQKNLRKNPCSLYFIAFNLANFVYIYSSLLALTLDVGYQINSSAHNLPICHLQLYISILFNCLSPFYLILAAIDRILITSPNALTRQKSTPRLAYISIGGGTLFWVLFHSHALILTNIVEVGPNIFICDFQPGVYLTFVSYYSIMKEIIALLLLIICSLWSIKNIRSTRRVVAAPHLSVTRTGVATNNVQSKSSKDRQMIMMLFLDVSIYASFSFLYGIYVIYEQLTEKSAKSYYQIQIENITRFLCLYGIGIPFCTSCYTNLIVSKTYRNEVKKLISRPRIFYLD